MTFKYATPDDEKYLRKLPARQHVVDEEDVSHNEAEKMLEELTEDEEDKEMLDVFEFRIVEHLSAQRTVKVKATSEELAEELVEQKALMLEQEPEVTHTVHEEVHKLNKVDEVPREKVENNGFYEEIKEEGDEQ